MNNSGDDAVWLRRMRWSARRGMLEVDSVLQCFLERADFSDTAVRVRFTQLLEESDDTLYRWLFGLAIPEDAAMCRFVADVRQVVQATPI